MNTENTTSGARRTRRRRGTTPATDTLTTTTSPQNFTAATAVQDKPTAAAPTQDSTRPAGRATTGSARAPEARRATAVRTPRTSSERARRPAAASVRAAHAGTGTLRVHPRGFSFVDLDIPAADLTGPITSCFVSPPLTSGLLTGDQVRVEYSLADGKATAATIAFQSRDRDSIYGQIERDPTGAVALRPDPHIGHGLWTIAVAPAGVRDGHAALATISGPDAVTITGTWPDPFTGDALLARIINRHSITVDYPADALAELDQPVAAVAGHRRDLRSLPTFTVDADSTRDLDDALSVYPAGRDGSLRVLVHIADVAAHVPAGSALDVEARRTGTSVYLPGWTRPMLPPRLSEDRLSLLPGYERDAITVEMRIDANGVITAVDVYLSRIVSDVRLNYQSASDILAGHAPAGVPVDIIDAVRWLRSAGARLGMQRARRGGIEARRVEPELTVHVIDGAATTVTATPSTPADLLIERLMVAANESVAGWLFARGLPGLFRINPAPGPDAAAALEAFCAASGYHPGFGPLLTPLSLAALSAQLDAAGDQTAASVWDVLLSHLGRAEYSESPGDHFGLASEGASGGYLHFTSPIRRYADLTVHRVIHAFLSGDRDLDQIADGLGELAKHLNGAAGVAARAESQMRKALWLATMATGSGPLTGHVSGVNGKGVFVTLRSSLVRGMVSVRDLPGRWELAADGLALTGPEGARLGVGDTIRVRLMRTDAAGELDFQSIG